MTDLLWSAVFLLLAILAAWAGKWWWFAVLIALAFALSMRAVAGMLVLGKPDE